MGGDESRLVADVLTKRTWRLVLAYRNSGRALFANPPGDSFNRKSATFALSPLLALTTDPSISFRLRNMCISLHDPWNSSNDCRKRLLRLWERLRQFREHDVCHCA
jgi:hypothetical protein